MKSKNPISKENKKIITNDAFNGIYELDNIYSNIDKLSIRDIFFIFHEDDETTNEIIKNKNLNIDFSYFSHGSMLIITYNFDGKPHKNLISFSTGNKFSTDLFHDKKNEITVVNTDKYSFMNLEGFKRNQFGFVAKGIELTHQFTAVVDSVISTPASHLSYQIEKDFPLIMIKDTNPLAFTSFFESLKKELIENKSNILELKNNFYEKIDLWNLKTDNNIYNLIPLNKQINNITLKNKKTI